MCDSTYCWRAIARQQTILYNSEKEPTIVGCKIVDMRSRLRFVYPEYSHLHYYIKCAKTSGSCSKDHTK